MWPIQLAFILFTVCSIYLLSLTLCNTSSLLTRSVQPTFSMLLQHHISQLSRYLWSTFPRIQVSAPHKATLQMQHFTGFFLKFQSSFLVKTASSSSSFFFFFFLLLLLLLLECVCHGNPELIPVSIMHHLLPYYPNSWNIPHAPVFLITEYTNKSGKATENSVNTMDSAALCEKIRFHLKFRCSLHECSDSELLSSSCMPNLTMASKKQASTYPSFHPVHIINTRIKPRLLNVYISRRLPIAGNSPHLAPRSKTRTATLSSPSDPVRPDIWTLPTAYALSQSCTAMHMQHAVNQTVALIRFTVAHSATRH